MAALSRAATSASPVATAPSDGRAQQVAGRADDGEEQADELGEPRRRLGLPLADGPEPRRDQRAEQHAVGRVPQAGERPDGEDDRLDARPARRCPVSRATASTTVVTQAPKRGPRTSITAGHVQVIMGWRPPDGGSGHVWTSRGSPSGGRTEAAADAAQVDCAARGQQGAHEARVTDHRVRPDVRVDQRGELVGPRGAAAAAEQLPVAVAGRTAWACGGRRARAPRRGGSRRRRARRRARAGWSAAAAAAPASSGTGAQNAVENWTTVRSASAGRDAQPREDRGSAGSGRRPRCRADGADRAVARAQPPRDDRRHHEGGGEHDRSGPVHSPHNRAAAEGYSAGRPHAASTASVAAIPDVHAGRPPAARWSACSPNGSAGTV